MADRRESGFRGFGLGRLAGDRAIVAVDERGLPLVAGGLAPTPASALEVPRGLRLAADWVWRLMVVAAGIWLFWTVMTTLSEVLIPLFVALLLTAAFWPLKSWLQARGMGRLPAVIICFLVLFGLVTSIFSFVGAQIASQSSQLATEAVASYHQFMDWLVTGPLRLEQGQIDALTEKVTELAKNSQSNAAGYATAAGAKLGHFLAGIALALFALFYFLFEGRSFARGGFHVVPRGVRAQVEDAALRGWISLVAYVRAAIIVAAVDGIGAGIGALLVGSNLFLAIGALTFITAFVPLLGAFTAGLVATSVVLVTLGWVKALIMLGIFVLVMEVEGHVLQPFLLGRAVSIHPLVVLYGLAIGMILGGIVGGLFTVPLMAFGNAFFRSLAASREADKPDVTDELPVPADDRVDADEVKVDDLPPGREAIAAVMEASAQEGKLPDDVIND